MNKGARAQVRNGVLLPKNGAWGMEPISAFATLMSARSAVKWLQSRRDTCYTEGTK